MRMRVIVLTLCVCVCVSVCPLFSGSIKRLYNTLITEIGFVLNAKEIFNLQIFLRRLLSRFTAFLLVLRHGGHFFVDMLTQHIA